MVFKKPVPKDSKTFSVPQTNGQSGWLIFTYDRNIPVCVWASNQDWKKVPVSVDERLCGDTFLRVEKIDPMRYVISDIWMYNSNCVFACSTFKQRYDWLKQLIPMFTRHIPNVTIELIHKSDLPSDIKIKGSEEYLDDCIGKPGYFVESDSSQVVNVTKLSLPDCYEVVSPLKGYLRVPDIKTSVFLREKGNSFSCRCISNGDESWTVVENIPEIEVNAS